MLYPEIAGASAENDSSGEAARMRREVVAPLLEATDIHGAFEEAMAEYGSGGSRSRPGKRIRKRSGPMRTGWTKPWKPPSKHTGERWESSP